MSRGKQNQKETSQLLRLIVDGATNDEIKKAIPKINPQKIYQHRYRVKRRMANGKDTPAPQVAPPTETPVVKPNDIQIGGQHYKQMTIQPWDAIQDWGLGYFSGNVVKYVARYKNKGGIEDLKKARHYLDKLIEVVKGDQE